MCGQQFKGTVSGNPVTIGVFVRMENGVEGYLRLAAISPKTPADFPLGTKVEVKIGRIQQVDGATKVGLDFIGLL